MPANKDLMEGQWFEDESGYLYIVPVQGSDEEIIGPDNAIADAMNADCRAHGVVTENLASRFALAEVSPIVRRYSEQDGYYHA